MALLEITDLSVRYGEIEALRGVTFGVEEGQVVTLLGSNGAGKSTTLRAISGLAQPASGEIVFDGHSIAGLGPEAIVRKGIAHVPEGRRVFPGLSVRENIMLGTSNRREATATIRKEADDMFDLFPDIRPFADALGWTLSGGQQQMVAVARGLMAKPRLLLLDEPSLGLAPVIVQAVFKIIEEIAAPRRDRAAGRAERAHGAQGRRLRPRARNRPPRARRHVGAALGRRGHRRRVSGRRQEERVICHPRESGDPVPFPATSGNWVPACAGTTLNQRNHQMISIPVPALEQICADTFERAGSSREEALRVARSLIGANLTGHDSHGVIRVPRYVDWVKSGDITPDQTIRLLVDLPSLAVVDGQYGFGQTVAPEAVRVGIAKCRTQGLSAVSLRDAGHIGRIGEWAEMAAAEGLVSIHFVTASGSILVAPFGAAERRLSTAPFSVGIPRENTEPVILDFATSVVAEGKVMVASQGGKKLPEGALVTPQGELSTDPAQLYGPLVEGGPRDADPGQGRDPRLRRTQGLRPRLHVRNPRRLAHRRQGDRAGPALLQRHVLDLRRSEAHRSRTRLRRRRHPLHRLFQVGEAGAGRQGSARPRRAGTRHARRANGQRRAAVERDVGGDQGRRAERGGERAGRLKHPLVLRSPQSGRLEAWTRPLFEMPLRGKRESSS